jgi:23S rRNA pseudouridine1911/1915/1917 synthase
MLTPVICHETEDFAIVFKPPRMHCAPLRNETLLGWYANIFPPIMGLSGRKEGEGGLLHRLDFETQGLTLLAKNQQSLENLLIQQKQGSRSKEYRAKSQKCEPDGFKVSPIPGLEPPLVIESYFRPYGPGRKQVRPVTEEKLKGKKTAKDTGAYYKTEVIGVEKKQADSREELYLFTVRLRRGFRHQIRCHLAWIGFPVLNDPLYGKGDGSGFLALRATGLFFNDPKSGRPIEFSVEPLTV